MKSIKQQFIEKYGEVQYKKLHKDMKRCFKELGEDITGKECHCIAKEPDDYFFFERYKLFDK